MPIDINYSARLTRANQNSLQCFLAFADAPCSAVVLADGQLAIFSKTDFGGIIAEFKPDASGKLLAAQIFDQSRKIDK
jgi:hypothetical protein